MSSQELPTSQGLSQVLSQDGFVSDSDTSSATDAPKSTGSRDRGGRRSKSRTRSAYEDSDCETRLSDSAEDGDYEASKKTSNSAAVKTERITAAATADVAMVDFRVRGPEAALSDEEEEEEEAASEPLGSTEETLSEASVTDLLESEAKVPPTVVSGAANENAEAEADNSGVPEHTLVVNEREQVDKAGASASPAAAGGVELSVVVTNEVNSETNAPASRLEPSDAAPPSESSVLVTSTSTTNSEPEPVVEVPSQPPPPAQPPRTLKRYAEMNNVQLKKQKLALENLKLALELGVITREECVEKGRLLVTQTST
ncbi:hypothetical protein Gpo141_00012259 [Globisporangium polare]